MSERYEGRSIDPKVYELADGMGWSAEVCVEEDDGRGVNAAQYILREPLPTKKEAQVAALQVGRQEVDKRI